jgi:hypothetical protein
MLQAATYFQWPKAIERIAGPSGLQHLLKKLEAVIDVKSSPPLRVRVIVDHDGEITVEASEVLPVPLENLFPSRIPIPMAKMNVSSLTGGALMLGPEDSVKSGGPGHGDPPQLRPWIVNVDTKQTKPSPFTTYKTTRRDMYVDARNRVGIDNMTEPKEVLIISETGNEIMEGSLTSVFFWRKGRWVTPPTASGGQAGTTRRWVLENGLCEEEVVCSDSLVNGEECWISNGVRGLIWGKISL